MSHDIKLNKILYVEDDPTIQLIARFALEDVGKFILKRCSSGQEALDCAATFEPDLLLLDVMMPGLDGPTTLQELRKLKPTENTPVIFMTGKTQQSDVAELKELSGTIEVIKKPFNPSTLASQLREAWERYQHTGKIQP